MSRVTKLQKLNRARKRKRRARRANRFYFGVGELFLVPAGELKTPVKLGTISDVQYGFDLAHPHNDRTCYVALMTEPQMTEYRATLRFYGAGAKEVSASGYARRSPPVSGPSPLCYSRSPLGAKCELPEGHEGFCTQEGWGFWTKEGAEAEQRDCPECGAWVYNHEYANHIQQHREED